MNWPLGHYEPSVTWWKLGESGRQPILDAIALLNINPVEVRSVTFNLSSATFTVIHRHNGHAHMADHCESPLVLHAEGDVMVCSCGRKMGEGHRLCVIEQTVAYPE